MQPYPSEEAPERVVVVASTVAQYELVLRELRLPRSRARFAVTDHHVSGVPLESVVVASPCLSRSVSGQLRYWDAVRCVEAMEKRDGVKARWIET